MLKHLTMCGQAFCLYFKNRYSLISVLQQQDPCHPFTLTLTSLLLMSWQSRQILARVLEALWLSPLHLHLIQTTDFKDNNKSQIIILKSNLKFKIKFFISVWSILKPFLFILLFFFFFFPCLVIYSPISSTKKNPKKQTNKKNNVALNYNFTLL